MGLRLPSLWLVAGCLLCSLPPSLARAEAARAQLSLRRGSELQVAVLHDGFHLGLIVAHLDERTLRQALAPLHAQAISLLPFGRDEQLAVLGFERPLRSAHAHVLPAAHRREQSERGPAAHGGGEHGAGGPAGGAAGQATPTPAGAPATGTSNPLPRLAGAAAAAAADAADAKPTRSPPKRRATASPHIEVELSVESVEPREAVLAHVMHESLPLPKTLAHHRLYDAEAAFVAGRLAEAELMLAGLKPQGPFAAWQAVRQGDLAVHHEDVEAACGHYLAAQTVSDVRVAAQLAALRARVLGCPQKMAVPWGALLGRAGRDDPVGRMMAKEAQWALGFEREVRVLDLVLAPELGARGSALPEALYDSLAARRLRLRPPFERVLAALQLPVLPKQHEAFDLSLELGQAYCALDVPATWRPLESSSRSWAQLAPAKRRALVAAVRACGGLDDPRHAAALAKAPPSEVAEQFAELERRTAVAARAARARITR